MNAIILPYKAASQSARALADSLGLRRVALSSSNIHNQRPKKIINWGNSGRNLPPQGLGDQHEVINTLEAVRHAGNKLSAFQLMGDAGVSIPEWTTDCSEVRDWFDDTSGLMVVVRNTLTGHSGEGIDLCRNIDEVNPSAPLFVKYVKKQEEYRVHIVKGEVIDVQRKARSSQVEDVNWQIRNHQNGFIFMREGVTASTVPSDVIHQAKQAISALSLDFGAVDVIWNQRQEKSYVLEVNTACGLEGTTLVSYTSAFTDLLNNRAIQPLEGFSQDPATTLEAARSAMETYGREVRRMDESVTSGRVTYQDPFRTSIPTPVAPPAPREFSVGDIVRIREDSRYYGRSDRSNPAGASGEVVSTNYSGDHRYSVRWPSGRDNCYRPSDLELVSTTQFSMSNLQEGTLIRYLGGLEGSGLTVGTIYHVTAVYPSFVAICHLGRYRAIMGNHLENFELVRDSDVQSTGNEQEESEITGWTISVDGSVDSSLEYLSRDEAELALVSPEFHNLRALGRTVEVVSV